jgi:hypothetical protein
MALRSLAAHTQIVVREPYANQTKTTTYDGQIRKTKIMQCQAAFLQASVG